MSHGLEPVAAPAALTACSRRTLLRGAVAGALPAGWLGAACAQDRAAALLMRPIASSGEALPLVGLGSWITFNVGDDRPARDDCAAVMRAFFDAGGRLIDSSPMYGSSQGVIGEGLARIGRSAAVFAADKVWVSAGARGPAQVE